MAALAKSVDVDNRSKFEYICIVEGTAGGEGAALVFKDTMCSDRVAPTWAHGV